MLHSCRVLDRCHNLPRNTQIRKALKGHVLAWLICDNRFIQTDHSLLNQVRAIRAQQKVRPCLDPDQILVSLQQQIYRFRGISASAMRNLDKLLIVLLGPFRMKNEFFFYIFQTDSPIVYSSYRSLCLTISYIKAPAATDAFKEFTCPFIGSLTI